ncbi:hypothetical protein TI39_contig954g00008 [Zymoseptoria brevis]|uniref:Heterokaryon incompatibility domain-containing protein n=1 Tax=Zymoseptoria brevis TaxID=1047168 RepID=A0A0F4GEN9_9PEZI|nr:hypothetical protein TI39_contig954g00008 [Zymoseptoria brevis]
MLFQYANLAAGSLRLVRFHRSSISSNIHLVLEHQDRYYDEDVHFSVLAYDGSNTSDLKSITLQGRTKLVPRSLWEALNGMFDFHDTMGRFWIDYVSINMKDDEEKRLHQAQLPRIYASADRVLAWVDSTDGTFEKAFADVSTQAVGTEARKAALEVLRSEESVKAVLDTPAMRSAKKIVLVCGKSACDIGRYESNEQDYIRQLL